NGASDPVRIGREGQRHQSDTGVEFRADRSRGTNINRIPGFDAFVEHDTDVIGSEGADRPSVPRRGDAIDLNDHREHFDFTPRSCRRDSAIRWTARPGRNGRAWSYSSPNSASANGLAALEIPPGRHGHPPKRATSLPENALKRRTQNNASI